MIDLVVVNNVVMHQNTVPVNITRSSDLLNKSNPIRSIETKYNIQLTTSYNLNNNYKSYTATLQPELNLMPGSLWFNPGEKVATIPKF